MLRACVWGKKSTSDCKKRYLRKVVPTVIIFACQKKRCATSTTTWPVSRLLLQLQSWSPGSSGHPTRPMLGMVFTRALRRAVLCAVRCIDKTLVWKVSTPLPPRPARLKMLHQPACQQGSRLLQGAKRTSWPCAWV